MVQVEEDRTTENDINDVNDMNDVLATKNGWFSAKAIERRTGYKNVVTLEEDSEHLVYAFNGRYKGHTVCISKYGRIYWNQGEGLLNESMIYAYEADGEVFPDDGGVILELQESPQMIGNIHIPDFTREQLSARKRIIPEHAIVLKSKNSELKAGTEVLLKPKTGLRMNAHDWDLIPQGKEWVFLNGDGPIERSVLCAIN